MGFGSDIARGAGTRLFMLLFIVFVLGGAIALGLWFGGSWIYEHVHFSIQ